MCKFEWFKDLLGLYLTTQHYFVFRRNCNWRLQVHYFILWGRGDRGFWLYDVASLMMYIRKIVTKSLYKTVLHFSILNGWDEHPAHLKAFVLLNFPGLACFCPFLLQSALCMDVSICNRNAAFLDRAVITNLTRRREGGIWGGGIRGGKDWRGRVWRHNYFLV